MTSKTQMHMRESSENKRFAFKYEFSFRFLMKINRQISTRTMNTNIPSKHWTKYSRVRNQSSEIVKDTKPGGESEISFVPGYQKK